LAIRCSLPIKPLPRGASVDRARLVEALSPLPNSAEELKAVAAKLGASSNDIYLGRNATEANVKRLPLTDYRVVYFATHGLVAGDVEGLGEPSLALTLPNDPGELDDGLLTASEIAQGVPSRERSTIWENGDGDHRFESCRPDDAVSCEPVSHQIPASEVNGRVLAFEARSPWAISEGCPGLRSDEIVGCPTRALGAKQMHKPIPRGVGGQQLWRPRSSLCGPRHQHCKYDRNENERRHISDQMTALGRIGEGLNAHDRPVNHARPHGEPDEALVSVGIS
jgi:CHAT domain